MRSLPPDRLLPGRLDDLARRFAPAWASSALDAGSSSGRGLRLLRPLIWLLVAATVVQSLLHVFDVAVLDLSVTRINADADMSLDGWLGTLTTGLAAWGALLLAVLSPAVRKPLLWTAALCAYLSMDDMLALHEVVAKIALRYPLYGHSGYDLWPAVFLPLLAVTFCLLLRIARSIDRQTGRCIALGLCLLVAAVGLESLAPVLFALGSGHGQPLYESEVTVEEAFELLGWGLIALALTAAVVDRLVSSAAAQPEVASRPQP